MTPKDLLVSGKALAFAQRGKEATTIGIVYNSSNPDAVKEAEATKALIGAGLKSGDKTLTPVMVKASDLAATKDIGAVFLIPGIGDAAAQVTQSINAFKIACVTSDIDLVKNGVCSIGVITAPSVQILVNLSAAAAANVSLDDAFRLMVTAF